MSPDQHITKIYTYNNVFIIKWGNEEREGKIPLEKGIGFDLKIVNEEYGYQVNSRLREFKNYILIAPN